MVGKEATVTEKSVIDSCQFFPSLELCFTYFTKKHVKWRIFYSDFKRLSTDLYKSCHLISFIITFKVTLCFELTRLNTDARQVTPTNMQKTWKVTGISKSLGRN